MAPRARFELATLRLTAEAVKNLSAASGVAYIRRGAILTFLAAPNLAPNQLPTTGTLRQRDYGSFELPECAISRRGT